MTDKEILQKAIEKVMIVENKDIYLCQKEFYATHNIKKENVAEELFCDQLNEEPQATFLNLSKVYHLIFSHDFAKAFWGKEMVGTTGKKISEVKPKTISGIVSNTYKITGAKPEWKYHLQQMVLEENPIQYLKKYI